MTEEDAEQKSNVIAEYINRLTDNINEALGSAEEFTKYKDLEIAFVELADMLTPYHAEAEVLLPKDQLKIISNRKFVSSVNYVETYDIFVNRFKIHLYSANSYTGIDDLDIKAYLYPEGLHKGNRKEITTFFYHFSEPDKSKKITQVAPSCTIEFALPLHDRSTYNDFNMVTGLKYGEVLFLVRTILDKDKDEYNPMISGCAHRYKYIVVKVAQTFYGNMKPTALFGPVEAYYTKPTKLSTRQAKPSDLSKEQALRKRYIFDLEKLPQIQSFKPDAE